ncbi:MAG: hypothetical protein GF344_14865 [Chitinivibrionales bacterium]|nr:hypothetical protein [Chitinivibrionales bacterium]MBD3357989.1 hypothetical protein [Chitinivibrionales bacterium]
MVTYSTDVDELRLGFNDYLRYLDYAGRTPCENVKREIDEVLSLQRIMTDNITGYRILHRADFTIEKQAVKIGATSLNIGEKIVSAVNDCEYMALFALSAGRKICQKIDTVSDDIVKSYMVSSLGSMATDRLVEILKSRIDREIKEHNTLRTGPHFGPGLCGWDLNDLFGFFTLFPPDFCDIQLTSAAAMIPIKSFCGIIAIGTNFKRDASSCAYCDLKRCFKRR